jgi:rhamnose utilization protein RhaD (predicted bifunctional aldolase and dehydrogenase)
MKVVLTAAKKKKGGVVLAAAKPKVGDSKTKKVSRSKKVRVTISNLGKKIDKAKEIRKAATDTNIEDIKKDLQKAALIKAGSKAPDDMLRQLYADFMMLKGRAL